LTRERAEIAEPASAAGKNEEREQHDDADDPAAAPEHQGRPARHAPAPPAVVLDL
jgi:hypothetical protein